MSLDRGVEGVGQGQEKAKGMGEDLPQNHGNLELEGVLGRRALVQPGSAVDERIEFRKKADLPKFHGSWWQRPRLLTCPHPSPSVTF